MRYAIAQLNLTIGDFAGNTQRICEHIAWGRAQGADLIIFPELATTGYPPRDLLELPDFIAANLAALDQIRAAAQGIGVVVGYVARNPAAGGRALHNSAALLDNGQFVLSQAKTLLPTYDVFDEGRHFAPAQTHQVVAYRGKRIGLSICEDCWALYEPSNGRRLYAVDPMRQLYEGGAELVINISASPFSVGKVDLRRELLRRAAKAYGYPILYVNLVGGNGELVFDGHSMALNADGDVVWQGPRFAEARVLLSDTELRGPATALLDPPPIEQVFHALSLGVRDYFHKCGFTKAILGLSGGIDSAVVACIAAEALGPEQVMAVAMPSPFTRPESVTDAELLAHTLGIQFEVIPIGEAYAAFREQVGSGQPLEAPDLAEENLQARIRGTILMTLSNRRGALLLSTGNKSELAVGYCTLYGDMTGGMAMLSDVPKTQVYELAHFINRDRVVIPEHTLQRPPSAELRPNQVDADSLPAYPILDRILKLYIERQQGIEEIVAQGLDRQMVDDVVRRVHRNEYKRQQAPLGIKVTAKAFGMGRRFSIVNKFFPA
ncbi:MAG: NAD+ synthase [Deltaproteobacteria bacterium]|nr:NAD+ synthase [Deltaproteobacteria bacterium]